MRILKFMWVLFIVYILVSFITLNYDIFAWGWGWRAAFIVLSFFICLVWEEEV